MRVYVFWNCERHFFRELPTNVLRQQREAVLGGFQRTSVLGLVRFGGVLGT